MDFKYKQLEQELSALSKVFSELGVRLSEAAKEVTAPGVNPSEKLIEQISASRASFESVRSAIHGHATAMMVSPLPKLGELVSIAAIDSLFKAAAVAEETKLSVDAEREKALAILGRVLSITHRETADFKPLQECHAKIGELRNAMLNVVWPHRHPASESIVEYKHPTTDFLHFVENLDQIDDERWMALETTITNSYGKPLFVAASRGKLAVVADNKPAGASAAGKPAVAGPIAAKPTAAPEAAKPAVAAEKPLEKKTVVEKAPEKPEPVPAVSAAPPVVSAEKKPTAPPATIPAAPAAATPATADKAPQKPVAPPQPAPSVNPVTVVPIQTTPAVLPEKKPAPPAVPAPAPAHPAAAASTPVVPQVAAPPAAAVTSTLAPPAQTPAMPPPTPTVSTPVPVVPAAAAANATPPASPLAVNINSLAALATATETEKKPAAVPADALDKQRKEPRLATPAPQSVSKPESKPHEGPETMRQETMQEGLAGDGSQRPQRWGFWRGNR